MATSRWSCMSRAAYAVPMPPLPRRRVSRYLPARRAGTSTSSYSVPQSHPRVAAAAARQPHAGHSRAGGPSSEPTAGTRSERSRAIAEPGGRRQRFEERDVNGSHNPVVEAPADDQNPDDLRAGADDRRYGVGPGHRGPTPPRRAAAARTRTPRRLDGTRTDPPALSSMCTIDEARASGGSAASRASKSRAPVSISPATSSAAGEPQLRWIVRASPSGRVASMPPRLSPAAAVAAASAWRWSVVSGTTHASRRIRMRSRAGGHQQQGPEGRRERQHQRIRDESADRALRSTCYQQARRHRRRSRQRREQPAAHEQPSVPRPHHLARVRYAHREHRVPQQEHPWKTEQVNQPACTGTTRSWTPRVPA